MLSRRGFFNNKLVVILCYGNNGFKNDSVAKKASDAIASKIGGPQCVVYYHKIKDFECKNALDDKKQSLLIQRLISF